MTTAPLLHSTLTDTKKRTWTVGTELGRGLWGRSWLVHDEKGRAGVLKVPLTVADFGGNPDRNELAEACNQCCAEQVELMSGRAAAPLPKLLGVVELDNHRSGYVMPRYPRSLGRAMDATISLEDALRTVAEVAESLASLPTLHGNLHPRNVHFDGEGRVVLADLATPALRPVRERLAALTDADAWTPPEAESRAHASWDSWALGQVLHAACHALPGVDPPPPPRLAPHGLDRDAVQLLKQRVLTRLGDEESNVRFRTRVAERMGALLSRALSPLAEPSPPYRFHDPEELAGRVRAVQALVRPHVEEVGRVLFPGIADDATFRGGEDVAFTVTVACSHGVTDHQDIFCGVQLLDLDAADEGRMPIDARFEVQVQPSGRLRYKLTLPEVPPGRYRTRAAFAVRDSGDEPVVVSAELEVRPPPGYVPPRHDLPPAPLPFPVRPIAETNPGTAIELPDDEDEHTAFPAPFGPPVDETDHGHEAAEASPQPGARASEAPASFGALDLVEELDHPTAERDPIDDDEPVLEPIPDPDVVTPLPVPPPTLHLDDLRDLPDLHPLGEEEDEYDAPTPMPQVIPVPVSRDPLPALHPVDGLANAGEDLPNWREKAAPRPVGWRHRLAVGARQDSTWAVITAVLSSILLVVAVSLLARAC